MDDSMPGLGTTLYMGDGGGTEVFTAVPGVYSIKGPKPEMGEREKTKLSSTFKEFRPTLPDLGEIEFSIYLDTTNAQHRALLTAFYGKTDHNFRLKYTVPTGTTNDQHSFSGWVKKFEQGGMEIEESDTADVSIRLTSIPVLGNSAP